MILITGGSASGKSEYGESLILDSEYRNRIYIATMEPFGKEAKERIIKHQEMRKEKNFSTIECYGMLTDEVVLWQIEQETLSESCILFECISNYLSNNMFKSCEKANNIEELIVLMIEELKKLDQACGELVIISNEIFSDGIRYDKETQDYIDFLGRINQELAKLSHTVIEVVCGIPVEHKSLLN
ncbi:MAG: bifunctional adenosylcobinamide kinase/adenosylcobinamide-phosphate guanylyltransferase [Eubacteriales bacterium]